MQRVFITIQLKKAALYLIAAMMLILVLSILIVGIGGKDKNILKKSSDINKYSLDKENIILKNSNKDPNIRVFLSEEKKIVELNIEEYVRGVVAGEMPAEFDLEALKAQAVAARTYGLAHMKQFGGSACSSAEGADVCDTVKSQVYVSKEKRFNSWPKSYATAYWNKITDAVNQTAGQILTYDGKLVMNPYYFSMSSGKTENAAEVFAFDTPYLKSVASEGDKDAKNFESSKEYTYTNFASIINSKYPKAEVSSNKLKNQIKITEWTSGGGSVKKIKIGKIEITGPQFREMMELRSSNFKINFNSKDIQIICKGYGHGVGMSQWGAAAMAKGGNNYEKILTHYYQGVKIEKIDSIK